MVTILQWLTTGIGLVLIVGTGVSLSSHPHWLIRIWDFPRIHIALLAVLSGLVYALCVGGDRWYGLGFLLALAAVALWQGGKIYPHTRLGRVQVQRADTVSPTTSLRLLITNVLMQNRQFDRLLQLIREEQPDMVLAAEVDDQWLIALQPLEEHYPYTVRQPQANMYGMLLLSRLELVHPQVRFRVQDDIPSIHTRVRLRAGALIDFYGVHPRPPEPLRGQDATPRDAELILVGREIRAHGRPTIVAGDLNDVAWSDTTRLFLQISQLLDPRVGRGFYNTFPAHIPLFRYPLDHVFHTNDFTLSNLRRLPPIGSDHFPMAIDLHYQPHRQVDQPESVADAGQEAEAQEKIDRALTDPQVRFGERPPEDSVG